MWFEIERDCIAGMLAGKWSEMRSAMGQLKREQEGEMEIESDEIIKEDGELRGKYEEER